jgi:hypothetical protein
MARLKAPGPAILAMPCAIKAPDLGKTLHHGREIAEDALDRLRTLRGIRHIIGHELQGLEDLLPELKQVLLRRVLDAPLAKDGLEARLGQLLRRADGKGRVGVD